MFDFDGPLFAGREAARRALAATADHFRGRFLLDVAVFDSLPLLRPPLLVQLASSELGLDPAQLAEIEEIYRQRLAEAEDSVAAQPEIERLLRSLKESLVPVGILSSRRKADVENRLANLGFGQLVKVCHGRDSLREPKPGPGALTQIAEELSVALDDLIFVGDSGTDFLCAQGARVTYYHVGWSGEPVPCSVYATATIFRNPADLAAAFLVRAPQVRIMDGQSLPDILEQAIENRDLCFYAGAGVSVASGIGDWKLHYGKVLHELGAGNLIGDGMDMPELLQLLAAQPDRAKQVFDRFRQSFDRPDAKPNSYHFAMMRAQPGRIWTSNYDQLFEKANSVGEFGSRVAVNDQALLDSFRDARLVVKMNGDFASATYADSLDWNLIFTQEQFDLVERQRPEIWRLFEDDYRNRCIVFVGVSFRDPALRRIVALARRRIPRTRYSHFLLARHAVEPVDQWKEDLQASNLRRQSIETFFFQEFSAIERFVCDVAIRSRVPIVGVCGSFGTADTLPGAGVTSEEIRPAGGSCSAAEVTKFGEHLGEVLAGGGFRVTSGCSPVVGIPPVSAAFRVAPKRARFYLRDSGGTRYTGTAPAIVVPGETGAPGDVYGAMRERFLSELSLLIAYGGAAPAAGRKSGTIEEIEMAMTRQIPVLIVPQVGGAAAAYRQKFLEAVDRSYPEPALAQEIRRLNEEVAAVPASGLVRYARSGLLDGINILMRQLYQCSLPVGRRESGSTDW